MAQIGVDVPIEAVSREELARRIAERRFTLVLQTWSAAGSDPDVFALWHSSQREHGANAAGLVDAENDRLLAQGRSTLDPAARAQIYAAWEQHWTTLIPSLPLFQPLLSTISIGVSARLDWIGSRLLKHPARASARSATGRSRHHDCVPVSES